MLLVEKYRPRKLEDVIGLDIRGITIDQNMPHLLLFGPPGTGKTTLAKIIISMLGADFIVLNASDERGIDVIREKVKSFASTGSSNGSIKIVFLDESDHLTNDAQTSLRNMMETYISNCRFILTANYISKIIEPLQSRCNRIEFGSIDKSLIGERLKYICKEEGIQYEDAAIQIIVDRCQNDIRRAINYLEEMKNGVFIAKFKDESSASIEAFKLLSIGEFENARQLYLSAHPDNDQFLKGLYTTTMKSGLSQGKKQKCIHAIADSYKFINQVAWKEILVEDVMLSIMTIMFE